MANVYKPTVISDFVVCPGCRAIFMYRRNQRCPACGVRLYYHGEHEDGYPTLDEDAYMYIKDKGWRHISKGIQE